MTFKQKKCFEMMNNIQHTCVVAVGVSKTKNVGELLQNYTNMYNYKLQEFLLAL